jgi:hypothetical protein
MILKMKAIIFLNNSKELICVMETCCKYYFDDSLAFKGLKQLMQLILGLRVLRDIRQILEVLQMENRKKGAKGQKYARIHSPSSFSGPLPQVIILLETYQWR